MSHTNREEPIDPQLDAALDSAFEPIRLVPMYKGAHSHRIVGIAEAKARLTVIVVEAYEAGRVHQAKLHFEAHGEKGKDV